jgi:hypothetical protein
VRTTKLFSRFSPREARAETVVLSISNAQQQERLSLS